MATWTNIPTDRIEPGKPIRAIDGLALRDNPIAIAEGASGAPKVTENAMSVNSIHGNRIRSGTVTNTQIANVDASKITGNIAARIPTGHGGVGTYAFVSTSGASSSWGGTIAGSHLRPANMTQESNSNFQVSSTSLAGTWRVMGYILGGNLPARGITLAVRIS